MLEQSIPFEEFEALMTHRSEWCVSLFMPTRRSGIETQEGPIRLKNLLGEVEKLLLSKGARRPTAQALLQQAETLLAKGVFWQQQRAGLALFLSPQMFRHYKLPVDFDEFVMVADRFYIKPLLPLLSGDGLFYVLALSLNGFRFLEGTRDDIKEIELENVPKNLAEALQYDVVERQVQHHVVPRTGGKGDSSAIFHGHGAEFSNEESILRFVRAVDSGICNYLKRQSAPLVLAGVEHICSIYRKATTYSNVLDKGISGNPELIPSRDLHQSAWNLVQPYFQQSQKEAIARFYDLLNTDRASNNLKAIVPAAYHGQVDTLFIEQGASVWGKFDLDENAIERHSERQQSSEDLLDFAAIHTLANRGTVLALDPEQMENGSPIAAIFRYPVEDA